MSLFYHPEIENQFQLNSDEAHHALKVLRLQPGAVIELTNGKGIFAKARITKVSKTECWCTIIEQTQEEPKPYSIHLAIAPTKNLDRMEWMVEKCVEIGVREVSFMITQHSERKTVNLDRIKKLAISAMKQSRQYALCQLHGPVRFDEAIHLPAQEKFIAFVDRANPIQLSRVATPRQNYLILVGPEGDFSGDELVAAERNQFTKVSLGPNRLRTETAGLLACHTLEQINF